MTWSVVQTEAQHEHGVRFLLMRLRLETYLPRIKIRNRIASLFPGYLFVQTTDRWYPILWTPHVIRLLMAGDKPAKVADEIVAELRKRERGGLVHLPKSPRLKRGQPVRVTAGSLHGLVGIYEGQSSRDRERVLLELLGRQVRIELGTSAIEPLPVASELAQRPNVR